MSKPVIAVDIDDVITALLFGDYNWNRDQTVEPGVVRVASWRAVQEYFDAKS